MEPGPTRVRGIAFRNLADVAHQHHGADVAAELVARGRGAAFDALRDERLEAMSFFPVTELAAGERLLAELVGAPEEQVAFAIGHHGLTDHLPRVFRLFLQALHPGFVLDRSTTIVRRYFDRGELRVTRRRDGFACLVARDLPGLDATLWADFRGATSATLEVAGAREVEVRIVEGGVADHAILEATWR